MCGQAYWKKFRYQVKLLNVLFWGIVAFIVILLPFVLKLLSERMSAESVQAIWKQLRLLLPLLSMPWLVEILNTWVEMKGKELFQFLDNHLRMPFLFAGLYDMNILWLYGISASHIEHAKRELFAILGLTMLVQTLVILVYQILRVSTLSYFVGASMCLVLAYLPNPILDLKHLNKETSIPWDGWQCFVLAAALLLLLIKRKPEYRP